MAALTITVSSFEILCSDCRRFIATLASVAEALLILTTMMLLLRCLMTDCKAFEDESEGSRTPAMTVLLGRARKVVSRLRPIPDFKLSLEWNATKRISYLGWRLSPGRSDCWLKTYWAEQILAKNKLSLLLCRMRKD